MLWLRETFPRVWWTNPLTWQNRDWKQRTLHFRLRGYNCDLNIGGEGYCTTIRFDIVRISSKSGRQCIDLPDGLTSEVSWLKMYLTMYGGRGRPGMLAKVFKSGELIGTVHPHHSCDKPMTAREMIVQLAQLPEEYERDSNGA